MTQPTKRAPSPIERIKNPAGRLDWLVCQLLGELIRRRHNPILTATYQEFKPQLEVEIMKALGPRNKHTRMIKQGIAIARQAILERQNEPNFGSGYQRGGPPC